MSQKTYTLGRVTLDDAGVRRGKVFDFLKFDLQM